MLGFPFDPPSFVPSVIPCPVFRATHHSGPRPVRANPAAPAAGQPDPVAQLRREIDDLRADYAQWTATALRHREDVLARYSPSARVAQLQAALAA